MERENARGAPAAAVLEDLQVDPAGTCEGLASWPLQGNAWKLLCSSRSGFALHFPFGFSRPHSVMVNQNDHPGSIVPSSPSPPGALHPLRRAGAPPASSSLPAGDRFGAALGSLASQTRFGSVVFLGEEANQDNKNPP
jgi:hypothetical protein